MGASTLKLNNQNILALSFSNEKDWHTYWKNPGDAGTEIKVKFFTTGEEVKLTAYSWPAPKRYLDQGDMVAYGYEKKYALFFKLDPSLQNKTLDIQADWLVCKDICIPGGQNLSMKLDKNLMGEQNPLLTSSKLKDIFRQLPTTKKPNFELFLNKGQKPNQLALTYIIENADFNLIKENSNILFPYIQLPLDFKHEKIHLDQEKKIIFGRIYIDWDGIYEEPAWELPADGIFKKPIDMKFLVTYPKNQPAKIISKTFSQFSLVGDKAMSDLFSSMAESKPVDSSAHQPADSSLVLILMFGFLGGLILNLMPCVLPVISLKLFGLIVHSEQSHSKILKHNLAYALGVIFSFVVLASLILVIQSGGSKIGWGFQLQSPMFVFFMLLLIFIMALNMLGLFEFVTPGGKNLGGTQLKAGFTGDFLNGILATILSTPCSAPFLGTALTYAFMASTVQIYLVFIAIAIGLSFPFLLTGAFPNLIRLLPKPGAWMEKLKNFLGLSLLFTAIWLFDVLGGLIDLQQNGVYVTTILVLVFFAFYFRKNISQNIFCYLFTALLPVLIFIYAVNQNAFAPNQMKSISQAKAWQAWTPEKLQRAKDITFVNFTAKWCLTCKVNKKLVLDSSEFKELVAQNNILLLEGDWTKRDQAITDFLASYNIVGVPAYFIKNKKGEVISLGETISISKIKDHLK